MANYFYAILLIVNFFCCKSLLLAPIIENLGYDGKINIYDTTNTIITGYGQPNTSINIISTNYLIKTNNDWTYPNQYVNLKSVMSGKTNPYIYAPYYSTGIFTANISNGSIITSSYLSDEQSNFVKSDVFGMYTISDGCFVATKQNNGQ